MKRICLILLVLLFGCVAMGNIAAADAPANLVPRTDETYRPISASPDGEVELCVLDEWLYIRRGSSILPVMPNESRGVPDAYENLAEIASWGVKAIGNEGVVWSPDGNYIALVHHDNLIRRFLFILDPMVIDTRTGEMFLLATYDVRFTVGDSATVVTACFSGDSRYLYAVMIGRHDDNDFSLVRYNLETFGATVLHSWQETVYRPRLVQLRDGSFLCLKDEQSPNSFPGLIHIDAGESGSDFKVVPFNQRRIFFQPCDLQYSAQSGYALILSNAAQGGHNFSNLLQFSPDNGVVTPEEYWSIPSLKAASVGRLVKNELHTPSKVIIHGMRLSPDGQHALLLCSEGDEYALRMLGLADGSLRPVTGVDSIVLRRACMYETPYIDWFGNTVALGFSAQVARVYTLE